MSSSSSPPTTMDASEPKRRPLGTTELSWCKAVPGGTGITVLALLLSKTPDILLLENSINKLQTIHPILNSILHFDSVYNTYSYITPPVPYLRIHQFDVSSTTHILKQAENENENISISISPLQHILEHELNKNSWQNSESDTNLFFASVYNLENDLWVLTLRLHTSICDRASAATLLRELLGLVQNGAEMEFEKDGEVNLAIEEYIPNGNGNKSFWARGLDMLGYSLNSLRTANLNFKDVVSPRMSRVVRLELNAEDTGRVLSICQDKEIKLCSLLAAAALIACHSLKGIPEDNWEKYAVVTLMDCRSILDPVLSSRHIGFYHSAILNTHDVKGRENLLELAKRVYMSFVNAKNYNKHFSDMADMNFLMCKAIENPSLTPSASFRTSLVSVFEDPMIDNSDKLHQVIGLEDFIGCASVHGVGPSMAIFDSIRDGKLDCACVYPFPLHSREQMQEFVDEMKKIVLKGTA